MIAVEWIDYNAPRNSDGRVVWRTGVLISLGAGKIKGEPDLVNVAHVMVAVEEWDEVSGQCKGDKAIQTILARRIRVKGVHVPFEPTGSQ